MQNSSSGYDRASHRKWRHDDLARALRVTLSTDVPAASGYLIATNGNNSALSRAHAYDAIGNPAAACRYDPYGQLVSAPGPEKDRFRHRFSTKPQDRETGLLYYGYRYLETTTGRWPSRDPIEEEGGVNLYGFVQNDGVNWLDILGGKPGSGQWGIRPKSKSTPVSFAKGTLPIRTAIGSVGSIATGDIFHERNDTPAYGDKQCKFLFTVSGINMRGDSQERFYDQVRSLPAFRGIQSTAWVNNPSNYPVGSSGAGDLLQILLNETILAVTVADQEMAKQLKLAAAKAKENGCCKWSINVVAHSQGTMIFRRAMGLLDADTKSHIHFTGLGGETIMGPNEGLGSSENFTEAQDPVPKLNPANWSRFRHEFDDPTVNGGTASHDWEDVYIPYLQGNPSVFVGRGDF